MRLIINGEERDAQPNATLSDLLRELEITTSHFAVAVNFQVVPKAKYPTTTIREGDKIEIVHAVGGGA